MLPILKAINPANCAEKDSGVDLMWIGTVLADDLDDG